MSEEILTPARWWHSEKNQIRCTLCPRDCLIGPGQAGFCYIRVNREGKLYSTGYGRPTGFAIDPIEKKPLNHFYPGTEILSFGTAGCNLGCKFCQNWSISKARLADLQALQASAQDVVNLAQKNHTPAIAFTYNDPTIFGEYVIDIAAIARAEGIRTVMVTAGYISPEARREIYHNIDAANVDLKGFTERFYKNLTYSRLSKVLDTLLYLRHETTVWLEITTLLIPGENDSSEEIEAETRWIVQELGPDVPLHFTAFHPDFKMRNYQRTPAATLHRAREIALKNGIRYCYVGNISDRTAQSTWCPSCGRELIRRDWHSVEFNIVREGCCPACGTTIPGRF